MLHTESLASSAVLDESAQTLFLTEMARGLLLTLKTFFEPKVTVSSAAGYAILACRAALVVPKAVRAGLSGIEQTALAVLAIARNRIDSKGPGLPAWLGPSVAVRAELLHEDTPCCCRSTIPLRRARSAPASGGSTSCGGTPPARSAA